MGFQKGNTYGKNTKRGKAKKTIVYESLEQLKSIGITPLETSKELIENLLSNKELSNKEKLNLLTILTSLFKYQLLSRADEVKLDELQKENEELITKNEQLTNTIIADSTEDLLKQLKEEK